MDWGRHFHTGWTGVDPTFCQRLFLRLMQMWWFLFTGGMVIGRVWSLTRKSLLYVNFKVAVLEFTYTRIFLQFLWEVSQVSGVWGVLKSMENAANLLLPLGIQKLKVFVFRGGLNFWPWDPPADLLWASIPHSSSVSTPHFFDLVTPMCKCHEHESK